MLANDPEFRARFEVFIREHGPLLVSAVVIAEVLIGIPAPACARPGGERDAGRAALGSGGGRDSLRSLQ